jgi:hypothetical protein
MIWLMEGSRRNNDVDDDDDDVVRIRAGNQAVRKEMKGFRVRIVSQTSEATLYRVELSYPPKRSHWAVICCFEPSCFC